MVYYRHMPFEGFSPNIHTPIGRGEAIASLIANVKDVQDEAGMEIAFTKLAEALESAGFAGADIDQVRGVIENSELFCRSESLVKVINALNNEDDICITERSEDAANMCRLNHGAGLRVAMNEGFSGKEVANIVKAVVTFKGNHIHSSHGIPDGSQMWTAKPETATHSLVGEGDITSDDIEMLTLRWPIRYFLKDKMTAEEIEALEDEKIQFVFRHYCRKNKTH